MVVGLRPLGQKSVEKQRSAKTALEKLLRGREISLREKWYVHGKTLSAVVTLDGKPVPDYLPERRVPVVEPSRKHDPADQDLQVRIWGGLPETWTNPIRELPAEQSPILDEVPYPTKSWLPGYEALDRVASALYVAERRGKRTAYERFTQFFGNPGLRVLIVFGECGVGKSWYTVNAMMKHRPNDTDFAYIDLRGRPGGMELTTAIHRELGTYLDQFVNLRISGLDALAHYLIPLIRPLFGSSFDPLGKPERDAMEKAYKELVQANNLPDYNDIRLGYFDNTNRSIYIEIDNVDTYPLNEQMVVFDQITRCLSGHTNVKLIVPLRPSSKLLIERLTKGLDGVPLSLNLRSPDPRRIIANRLSTNFQGAKLDLARNIPSSAWTWNQLAVEFPRSHSSALLRDLSINDSDIPPSDENRVNAR